MSESELEEDTFHHDDDELREAALSVRCPKCRMGAGMACVSAFNRFLPNLRDSRPGLHAERLAEGRDRLNFTRRLNQAGGS